MLVTAVVLVLLVFGSTSARAAAEVVRVSWWTERSAAIATPPGGFEVARTLDGLSVAAVRVQTTGAVLPTTLALQEVPGAASAGASVQICAIPGDFADASGDDLAGAPATECANPTTLSRGFDLRWTADITPFLTANAATSFAIVPGSSAADGAPFDPGFYVVFAGAEVEVEEPATSSTQPGDSDGSSTTTVATTTPTTEASTPPPTFGGAPPPTAIVPQPVPPPTFPPPPDPAVTPTTIAAPVQDDTAELLDTPTVVEGPISGSSGEGAPWERLLVLVPLSAVAGLGSVYGRRLWEQLNPAT